MRANPQNDWMERSRLRNYFMSRPPAQLRAAADPMPYCRCGRCEPCIARECLKAREASGDMGRGAS